MFLSLSLNLKYSLNELIDVSLRYILEEQNRLAQIPNEDILLNFYAKFNTEKATSKNVKKILKKYNKREKLLLEALEIKYDTFIPNIYIFSEIVTKIIKA